MVLRAVAAVALAVVVVAGWWVSRRGVIRSRDNVARYVEDMLDGGADDRVWDEFLSIRIRDRDLDRIRRACIGNETNPLVLRSLLDELRGGAA